MLTIDLKITSTAGFRNYIALIIIQEEVFTYL